MTVPALLATVPNGPDGAPLMVLGPSLGTSTLLWDETAELLRASFRVTAWDLPGHGLSPAAREPFTVAELADGVVNLLDALGQERVYYAGDSLGGSVGLELALRHPERLLALADVCSSAKFGTAKAWHERAAQVRSQGTAALVVQSAQRWFAPGSIERHPVVSGRLLHALRDADDESYALCCEALAGFDVRARLGEIGAPVRVIWGEHDAVVPREAALEVAEGVKDGALVPIADAAHLAPAEQPEAVAEALAELAAGVTA